MISCLPFSISMYSTDSNYIYMYLCLCDLSSIYLIISLSVFFSIIYQ